MSLQLYINIHSLTLNSAAGDHGDPSNPEGHRSYSDPIHNARHATVRSCARQLHKASSSLPFTLRCPHCRKVSKTTNLAHVTSLSLCLGKGSNGKIQVAFQSPLQNLKKKKGERERTFRSRLSRKAYATGIVRRAMLFASMAHSVAVDFGHGAFCVKRRYAFVFDVNSFKHLLM